MRSPLLSIAVLAFLSFIPQIAHAQGMMGGLQSPGSEVSISTARDEAEGKAVWDKLQNKQSNCSNLTDDDFDVLGDFFMGNMIGSNHASMNQLMAQRLGDEGEKQMHIAMGKRLSGCDTNAAFPNGAGYFMPMMGFSGAGMMNSGNGTRGGIVNGMMGSSSGIFGLITWIAIITFLLSGSLYSLKGLLRKKSK